ncbi:MAG: putative integral rane protein [Frankiales bacterium]|nr:putative integral rane protein [Frankiales bacterium]
MGETKDAAKKVENSTAVEWLARLGLFSRGVVWLVVGLLAVQVALGKKTEADKNGALKTIADKPFGHLLLVVLVIGFFGYAAWRLLEGAVGHRDEDAGRKRWTKRGTSLFRGAVYLGLAISTLKFLVSGGGNDKTQPLTARVMKAGGGRELVFVIGAGVVIGGLAMVVRAFRQKFEDKLDLGAMPARLRSATTFLGTAGIASRGLVFALIGWFLIDAAVRFNPDKAKGLDASLKTVAHQPFGRVLLFAAALGLLAFSLWSFIEARYRKI